MKVSGSVMEGTVGKSWAMVLATFVLVGCAPEQELPEHSVEMSSLAPKSGSRVQVSVRSEISEADCSNLIERYRSDGSPDGQVSVHMPSALLNGTMAPWCVENFDGSGIKFNRTMF